MLLQIQPTYTITAMEDENTLFLAFMLQIGLFISGFFLKRWLFINYRLQYETMWFI